MNTPNAPSFGGIFSLNKHIDYSNYLENTGDFRRLPDNTSVGMRNIAYSVESLKAINSRGFEASISSLDGVAGAIDSLENAQTDTNNILESINGAAQQSAAYLNNIFNSTEKTNKILINGFDKISAYIDISNSILQDTRELLKSFTTTAAYEHFSISKAFFKQELFEDSLEHLNYAINGSITSTGYRGEPLFHLLQGAILLGAPGRKNGDYVNPG